MMLLGKLYGWVRDWYTRRVAEELNRVHAWEQAMFSKNRTDEIREAEDTGCCPHCGAGMGYSGRHERDSSNDLNYCPKCDWGYYEMEAWSVERAK